MRERRRAKLVRDQVGSRSRHERYRSLDRQVKSSAREDKQKWLDSVGADIERAASSGEHRRMYQLVKQLSCRYAAGTPSVKGEDGTPLKDREEVKSRWAEYFNDLLNRWPPQRRLHRIGPTGEHLELSEDPGRLEVEKAIQKLKNNKAPKADGIVAEMIRLGPAEPISMLHQLFMKIWADETVLDDWTESLICFQEG